MADFQLQLDVVAQTQKLEAGLKRAEAAVGKTTAKMDKEAKTTQQSFESMLGTIGKVGAGLFLAEGGFRIAGAAMSAMAGDAEEMDRMLQSLPIFGPLVTAANEFSVALERNSQAHRSYQRILAQTAAEAHRVADAIAQINGILPAFEENLRLQGKTEFEIAQETYRKKQELLELERAQRMQLIEDEAIARAVAVEELDLEYEDEIEALNKIRDLKYAAMKALDEELAIRKQNVRLQFEAADAADLQRIEEERIAELAARQEQIDKSAEAHQKEIMRLEEEANKEREAAAEAERKAQEDLLAFTNKRLEMEKEIADARAEAERQVAGATATFSTAGGSFTAGVSAQVNEAKLLTKISQQSRDFLAQIVQNTMGLPGVLSLG